MFGVNQTSTQDSNVLIIFQTTYWGVDLVMLASYLIQYIVLLDRSMFSDILPLSLFKFQSGSWDQKLNAKPDCQIAKGVKWQRTLLYFLFALSSWNRVNRKACHSHNHFFKLILGLLPHYCTFVHFLEFLSCQILQNQWKQKRT